MNLTEQAASLTHGEIVALLVERERNNEQLTKHTARISELEARVRWFEKQLFGRKSERRLIDLASSSVQLPLGLSAEEQREPSLTETVKSYQRRVEAKPAEDEESGQLRFSSNVPVEVIEVPNPAIEGVPAEHVSEKVTHRLARRPGSHVVLKYVRKVVKLSDGTLSAPPAPASVIDRSIADVSFLAGLLVDKFVYHLPLYRQHQRLLAEGVTVSRQTLTNLVHRAVSLLEPVYYSHLSSILGSKLLAMDETPVKAGRVGPGKLKTAYFWPLYGDKDEVAFPFSSTRAHETVRKILGEYSGTLLSDGYDAYERFVQTSKNVVHAQCWAHTRRHFVEAEKADPDRVKRALDLIGQLYEHEKYIRESELGAEECLRYRGERSWPIVDEFFTFLSSCLQDLSLLSSNPFIEAASYAMQRRAELSVFLSDPAVPLDTNHLERALRVIAMGRKNWLFCWTEVGAEVVGKIQSLLVSCRLHGVDPFTYLVDVLQRIDSHPATDVDQLTPRLWKQHFATNPLPSDLERVNNAAR